MTPPASTLLLLTLLAIPVALLWRFNRAMHRDTLADVGPQDDHRPCPHALPSWDVCPHCLYLDAEVEIAMRRHPAGGAE